MEPLNIGIDFGGTGLRVAYAVDEQGLVILERPPGDPVGWLVCERSSSSPLGVTFPSLKSRLGTSSRHSGSDGGATQSWMLTEALGRAKRDVEEHSGRPVAQAVVCVPARYTTAQRTALHEAAMAAGFTAAHLINDSVGAVIAHAAGLSSSATVLVFSAGYEGFELGLARVVKGHVRVLGYEGGAGMAGAALDQLVLEGWAGALASIGVVFDWSGLGVAVWTKLRAAAQLVKEQLGIAEQVEFEPVEFPVGILTATFSRRSFEQAVRQAFQPAVSRVETLLERAGLTKGDVDIALVSGGTTRVSVVRDLFAETLGCAPATAPPDLLARGAALHAAGLDSRRGQVLLEAQGPVETQERTSAPGGRLTLPASASFTDGLVGESISLPEMTLAAGDVAGIPALLPPGSLEQYVARLVEAGETKRARAELGELIDRAQAALDGLPPEQEQDPLSPTSPAYRSRLALSNARSHLQRREFAQAVSESHYAWKISPGDPQILDDMIDVHCDAAMANHAPEQYDDAIRWLRCALGHDESNARTRTLLADRHYLHAQHLHRHGQLTQALEAIEHCLLWNPDHTGAAELQRTMTSE